MFNKHFIFMILGLLFVLAIPIVLNSLFIDNQAEPPTDNPPAQDENNGDDSGKDSTDSDQNNQDDKKIYWGVDSASATNDGLYQCVKENFGEPKVWGRYIGDKEGVSAGLTADEAKFLHEKDVQILLIYNHFTDATGYDHGVEEAKNAISIAKDLDVPEGVAIFGDIEPKFPVDSAFMEGWYDTLTDSTYEPGIYGVFDKGSAILEAYNAMKQEAKENTVVWTSFPQKEITTKENAPEYNPQGPEESLLYGWQYAIEAEQCAIDTDLYKGEIADYLW